MAGVLRAVFFLPSLVPTVYLAAICRWLFNGDLGLVNQAINLFSTLVVLPVITLFFLTQKSFIEGIATTSGK